MDDASAAGLGWQVLCEGHPTPGGEPADPPPHPPGTTWVSLWMPTRGAPVPGTTGLPSHAERIHRQNEIATKVARYARKKGWTVETEPYVYYPNGQLCKPKLAIHLPKNSLVVCHVQVSWEGTRALSQSWENKRLVYDNIRFREAARRRWGAKDFVFVPLILGARGVWPRANIPTTAISDIPPTLRASCVHSCLKWGSTIVLLWQQSRGGPRTPGRNQQRGEKTVPLGQTSREPTSQLAITSGRERDSNPTSSAAITDHIMYIKYINMLYCIISTLREGSFISRNVL